MDFSESSKEGLGIGLPNSGEPFFQHANRAFLSLPRDRWIHDHGVLGLPVEIIHLVLEFVSEALHG